MSNERPVKFESKEKGTNVEIVLKFMRHGERDKNSNLIDLGRDITKQKAKESGIVKEDFDAIKPIGSNAGPMSELNIGRALETAQIYAREIAGDEAFRTRINDALNYETLMSPSPYKHVAIYNANLPENFETLTGDTRIEAANIAQQAVFNHLVGLETPEAITYKREVAGAFAYMIEHYEEVAQRLKSGSKALIPAGTHGGTIELLLQQAMVWTNSDGQVVKGFHHGSDIGGSLSPSEAFNVDIKTDDDGKLETLYVTFDNPKRPQGQLSLDRDIIRELAENYRKLHDTK